MLRRVARVRTDVSEELSASIIRVTSIGELGTTLPVTLMKEALSSSETSILTRTTRRNIPEDTILRSHRRENLKSYISYFVSQVDCFLRLMSVSFCMRLSSQACYLSALSHADIR
jgi:hypothetical protein